MAQHEMPNPPVLQDKQHGKNTDTTDPEDLKGSLWMLNSNEILLLKSFALGSQGKSFSSLWRIFSSHPRDPGAVSGSKKKLKMQGKIDKEKFSWLIIPSCFAITHPY